MMINIRTNIIIMSLFLCFSSCAYNVVLITGISQGIGLEIAKKLAQNSYIIYGTVRSTSNLASLSQAMLVSKNIIPLIVDVTNEQSIVDAIKTVLNQHGQIDVLINNACEVVIGPCEVCTIEEQQRVMDVNYFGVVRMLHAVLPTMRKQKSGYIINISSIAGFEPFPIIESYVASKFALEGLSESLASYLLSWGIKVSLIEPGGVKTQAAVTARKGSRVLPETTCYEKFCTAGHQAMIDSYDQCQNPEDIAQLVLHILSTDKPLLRYQTNTFAHERACARFQDRTGTTLLDIKQKELKEMLDLLDEQ